MHLKSVIGRCSHTRPFLRRRNDIGTSLLQRKADHFTNFPNLMGWKYVFTLISMFLASKRPNLIYCVS